MLGLDITTSSVKLIELSQSGKRYRVESYSAEPTPPSSVSEKAIVDAKAVGEAIRRAVKRAGAKATDVAVAISGDAAITKVIQMPSSLSERDLEGQVEIQADQYIPFPMEEVSFDYEVIGPNEKDPELMDVLLVATRTANVEQRQAAVSAAGLDTEIVDVEAFALQNTFEVGYDPGDDNIALIDIGASKTSLNILKGNSSVFMRDVSLGCSQINQKIISLVDCSFDEAENLKFGDNPERLSAEDLKEIVSSVVSDWCTEIRRALDFFYSTYPDDQIKRIILSGGGASISEFRELLGVEASAEVETINPFKGIYVDDRFDPEFIKQIAPQAAITVGLALRKVNDK